jgi:N-acetylglucosaminyldiphosphoundecaprenol N-acetyl-beta-D-mannosaminyltransferase
MRDLGKRDILGVSIDAVDEDAAVERVIRAAKDGIPYGVSALAVHGVMEGVDDPEQRHRLNALELLTPDGQPVRWALNLLHATKLPDRVYGPKLMLRICREAAHHGLPVYLYGNRPPVLAALEQRLSERFPELTIAGSSPSLFRRTTDEEKREISETIRASGAAITFVGLGCPRQEVFAYEYRDVLGMPVVAVGAAFDYHAGVLQEPPEWIQRAGLQWLYRLSQDPVRLWRRYTVLNGRFLWRLAMRTLGVRSNEPPARMPSEPLNYG